MGITFLGKPDLSVVVVDSWVSIMRAVSCVDLSSQATLDKFDELAAAAQKKNTSVFAEASQHRSNIDVSVGTMLLLGLLRNVNGFSDQLLMDGLHVLRVFPKVAKANGTFEQRLLDAVLLTGPELVAMMQANQWDDKRSFRARDGFRRMARLLREAGKLPEANVCILSALNVSLNLPPDILAPVGRESVSIALQLNDSEVISAAIFRQAQLLVFAAEGNEGRQLEAFDAVESAIRSLPDGGEMRASFLDAIGEWLNEKNYLRMLGPLFWSVLRGDERTRIPPLPQDQLAMVARTMARSWKENAKDFFGAMAEVGTLHIEIENRRLALVRSERSKKLATATWDSWSLLHPNLLHSIPHSSSVLRESNLNDYLLTLAHEITHIYSMTGPIGVASAAMRWALFDFDLELWSLSFKTESFAMDEIVGHMLESAESSSLAWWRMPTDELSVHRLWRVEQALDLAQKIQILEDTWSPWFEGLAIFAESADPKLDAEHYSPVARVVSQLVDYHVGHLAQEQHKSPPEIVAEKQRTAEELYSTAIAQAESGRLRAHIGIEFRRYLAGYLLVRSIVGAWRRTLGRAVSGTEAFRILLHVTRFSYFDDVLPDVRVSAKAFEQQLRDKHRTWVKSLSAISKADLLSVLGEPGDKAAQSTYWKGGNLHPSTQEYGEQTLTTIAALARDALRPQFAPPEDRVAEASPGSPLNDLMLAINQLREIEPAVFVAERIPWILSRNWILPIGQVKCLFWIVEENSLLACLLRTTEENKEATPSYDLLAFSLSQEELAGLQAEMHKTRDNRMEVTRVADLANPDLVDGRGFGRNLLAFRFGEWMFLQPRGLLFGSHEVSDDLRAAVERRIAPPPLVSAYEQLAADLRGFAKRALTWLGTVDSGSPVASPIEFSSWLEYVKSLANKVSLRQIGQAAPQIYFDCLEFVTGDHGIAQRLQEKGLEPLRDHDPKLLQDLIRLLIASGQQPDNSEATKNTVDAVREVLGIHFEDVSSGWDIVPAELGREVSDGTNNSSQSTSV